MNVLATRVPMRDAVELAADVYLPDTDEPRPALVQRTPYGKDVPLIVGLTFTPADGVARGYAVVVQDCRGCGASEGEFHAFVDERADGHDTVAWVAAQAWCDGRVGVFGSSYMGATALQAAVDPPPALRAAMAYLTGPNYYDGWIYSGGMFELGTSIRWTLDQAERIANWRGHPNGDGIRETVARFRADPTAFLASGTDLASLPGPAELPHWREWVEHTEYDDYWRSLDVVAAARDGGLTVPLLQVAAWYDLFGPGQLELHKALQGDDHRLVIGPWDHNAYLSPQTATTAGVRDFGPQTMSGPTGVGPLALDWFDRWLGEGRDHGIPPVRYFAIGPDRWRDAVEWPPPHQEQRWYLHGGGSLGPDAPRSEASSSLPCQPASPAPTVGGRHVMGFVSSGVQDHAPRGERDDVLVFVSEPLPAPLSIAGPVRLELHVEPTTDSSAAFVATLVDVQSDGAAWNVAEGIRRVGAGTGAVDVDLGHAAYEFGRGRRIGLQLSRSSYPRFGLVGDPTTEHVLHDDGHPSALVLSVEG